MKKLVIILLVVVFSLSLFLGCQKKAEKVVDEVEEVVDDANADAPAEEVETEEVEEVEEAEAEEVEVEEVEAEVEAEETK